MADTMDQLTSLDFWLTGIALVVLGWLLEPLRPLFARLITYSADKLVVLSALSLVIIVAFYHVPLYGRPFLDTYLAVLYASFYTMMFLGMTGLMRLVVAYIPPLLFCVTFIAFRRAGLNMPFEGATHLFPFFIFVSIFLGSPFLLFEAIFVRRTK